MVSIIIPVFNTEKYLHKCLDSILNQSYSEFEIIAVNDGSTDSSLKILEEYKQKDSRVRVIDKKNEGQGIARNIAIQSAQGDLIYCVDSDDWITENSLSVMVNRMTATNADIVIGNSACTFLDSEEIRINNNEKMSGLIEGNKIKNNIFNISATTWPKLIKKTIFFKNDIWFPNIFFEDLAVLPLIFAKASRIAFVNKCVYIQRMNSSSTVHKIEHIYDRIKFVEYMINDFKRIGLYEDYEEHIKDYLSKRAQINLRVVKELGDKIYHDFSDQQQIVWKERYGIETIVNRHSFCFGSYNLMIITKIFMHLDSSTVINEYFGGSSLISCMNNENENINKINVVHKNGFRRKMLINDFERRFMRLNPANFYDYDFLFVDFLEERYDIGKYKGEYFTISQAFLDIKDILAIEYEKIPAFSEPWWILWKEACDRFVDKILSFVGNKKIVLVKTYLSEKYFENEDEQLFPDIDRIREINIELGKCYSYFQMRCPSAIVIDIAGIEEYRTDKSFRHGCAPWHLSDFAYGIITKHIENTLYQVNIIENK